MTRHTAPHRTRPVPRRTAGHALGAAVAALAVLTACGGADADPAPAGERGSGVLLGSVGTPEDPEAYEIALTYEDGEPVTSLPAGEYTIRVSDPATMHNFHLTGGSVDESTSVPEIEETTFTVTLEPGEYTYTCDPHPAMTGTVDVV